jgi:tetratricopeptide (TPR) repeat protein
MNTHNPLARAIVKKPLVGLVLGSILVFASPTASAEGSAPAADEQSRAAARDLMAQGRAERAKGDLQAALASFSKAHELMGVPTTLYEVAATQADLGQLVLAYDSLRDLEEAQSPNEPAAFERARKASRALLQTLETKLPVLYVSFDGFVDGESIDLTIDGKQVPLDTYKTTVRLDPGDHVISARTRSAKAEETISLAESEKRELLLELRPERLEPAQQRLTRKQPGDRPHAEAGTSEKAGSAQKSPSLLLPIAGGVALLGVTTGTVFALMGRSNEKALRDKCAPRCLDSSVQKVESMYTTANIGFGVGAAAAVSAVVIFALQATSSEKPAAWSRRKLSVDVASLAGGGGLFRAEGQF